MQRTDQIQRFNAAQTEELIKYGRVTSDGGHGQLAMASGTAYNMANAYSDGSKLQVSNNKYTAPTGSSTTTIVDNSTNNSNNNYNYNTSSGSSSSNNNDDAADEFKETIDWIEVAIDRIERKIANLDTQVNRTYKTWSSRNSKLTKEISKIEKEIDKQNKAYDKYIEKAESVMSEAGLSDSTIKKIEKGAISIKDYTNEETYSAIQEALSWCICPLAA